MSSRLALLVLAALPMTAAAQKAAPDDRTWIDIRQLGIEGQGQLGRVLQPRAGLSRESLEPARRATDLFQDRDRRDALRRR